MEKEISKKFTQNEIDSLMLAVRLEISNRKKQKELGDMSNDTKEYLLDLENILSKLKSKND